MTKQPSIFRIIRLPLFLAAAFFFGHTAAQVTDFAAASSGMAAEESWGLSFREEGKPPEGNADQAELARYDAFYLGDTDQKTIYLTFDAGYETGYTASILDVLKAHKVQAAFFMTGSFISENPELVQRIQKEGHTAGNHTATHPDLSSIASKEAFKNELEAVEKAYQNCTGRNMKKFYRPPRGKYSTANLKMAQSMGYHTFFWSLAYVDWYQDRQPSREEALDTLTRRIHPGAIVLLHSTSQTNSLILDELLDIWTDLGYSFGSLEDLAASEDKTAGLEERNAFFQPGFLFFLSSIREYQYTPLPALCSCFVLHRTFRTCCRYRCGHLQGFCCHGLPLPSPDPAHIQTVHPSPASVWLLPSCHQSLLPPVFLSQYQLRGLQSWMR